MNMTITFEYQFLKQVYVLTFCHVIELFTAQNPFQKRRIFLFWSKTFDTRKENLQLKFGHVKVCAKTKLFWVRIIFVWFLLCIIDLSGILVSLKRVIMNWSKLQLISFIVSYKEIDICINLWLNYTVNLEWYFIYNFFWDCSWCNENNNCKWIYHEAFCNPIKNVI